MSKRALWFPVLLVLCASCQKVGLFRDMMALRGQIGTQFHEERVQVNVIHGDTVVVTFINSPLIGASSEDKQKRADEVAAFVMKHSRHQMREVRTFFVAKSGGIGGSVTRLDRYTGHPRDSRSP